MNDGVPVMVRPAGTESVTWTPVAVELPVLDATMVNVTAPPGDTVIGSASLVIATSTLHPLTVTLSEELSLSWPDVIVAVLSY